MFYNHIYNLQFKGNDQVNTNFFYKVKFEKREDTVRTPDVIDLIPAQDSPFVLNYKATEDNIFSPIRASFADIKCFIPAGSIVQPSDFFFETDEYSWRVTLYENNGTTDSIKWRGFLLPDVIQYEWQEQYYLQLTASDNLATLKNIKYSREDIYALFDDTSVYYGISIKDFVCKILKKTGSDLNVAIFSQLKIADTLYNIGNLKVSDYSGMDWKSFQPKDCYFLITNLMRAIGCVLYQSNSNGTWYIVSINDVAVNDLVFDGTFSISGALPPIYEYWETVGDVVNSPTGGLNGSQCPKIFGDNTSYVSQTLGFQTAEYLVSFWAKNFDTGSSPKATVRVEIAGSDEFTQTVTDDWVYYEFTYFGTIGSSEIRFFNANDDSTGYLLIDNVSVTQKFQNGIKYDINGNFIAVYTFDFYSSIGNQGNVIWSDANQLVSLNKRLTGVQYLYPNFERNLVDNFGFYKDYSTTTQIPTDWQEQGSFGFFQLPDAVNTPFDARTLDVFQKQHITSGLDLGNYLYTNMLLTNFATDLPPRLAIKIECAVKFSSDHNDNDYINIAFVKSSSGTGAVPTRYLDYKGDWYPQPANTLSASFNRDTRIPIFLSDKANWVNFKCLSRTDTISNFGTLIIRPQINNNYNDTFVEFDNFKVSIIPQGWENVISNLYVSTNLPNSYLSTKVFSNIYRIENTQYQGGRIGSYQSQIIEDFIGIVGEEGTIKTSDKWLRIWEVYNPEVYSESGRPLNCCSTNSVLSFYQNTWQKFSGNVYGKNISFGQVFNIALAQGLHFMHEATFDYVNNKTNITTHQSQTDKLEIGFRSWATDINDSGAGQGQPGSTTSKIQDVESLITPPG
jgi:hypothetical protein